MAKIKKKGTAGQAKNFITRTQAVRKLQISLPDFRRLCIFKGIYPREPRNKRKASKTSNASTTFYYTKDIQYLLHEPLLNKFREHKALSKKIARSLGRGEVGDAARLEKSGATKLSLDHVIKERYPTFADALRDLDDALSLLFLFANLPATLTVAPKTIALCQRLCHEFQHYLIASHSLRKSFLSIKGIYYQATVQGEDILWLVPYKFVQRVTGDVDFRIMGTFVEFYTTLLGFVNLRLYTSIGLIYPPKFDRKSDEQGGELGAFTLVGRDLGAPILNETEGNVNDDVGTVEANASALNEDVQKRIDALGDLTDPTEQEAEAPTEDAAEEPNDAIDTFETTGAGADVLPQPQMSGSEASVLFEPFTFFLSRETPRQPLEFILRAFGCKRIGWDAVLGDGAFTHNESDPTITHQVVDRPSLPLPTPSSGTADPTEPTNHAEPSTTAVQSTQNLPPGHRVPGRTYIQPQWVWDCINDGRLLRTDHYAPGAMLPPHLSPWIKASPGTYDPRAPLAAQEREGEAAEFAEAEAEAAALVGTEQEARSSDSDNDSDDKGEALRAEEGARQGPEKPGVRLHHTDDAHGMAIAGSEDEGEEDDASATSSAASFAGFDSADESPDETERARLQHQAELEAEAKGLTFAEATAAKSGLKGILKARGSADEVRRRMERARREARDEVERRKGMMGRKRRKLFEKMVFGRERDEDVARQLRAKRRKVEGGGLA